MTESNRQAVFMRWCRDYETQENLAAALGVSQGYIGQLKKGLRPITEKTARKFEKALGLPPGQMDVAAAAAASGPIPYGSVNRMELVTDIDDLSKIGSDTLERVEIHVPRLAVDESHIIYTMPDNSMTPVGTSDFGLIAGDYALVDTSDKTPENGSLVLAEVGGALVVRQLIGDSLVASNKYFNDIRDEYLIVGVVRQRCSSRAF